MVLLRDKRQIGAANTRSSFIVVLAIDSNNHFMLMAKREGPHSHAANPVLDNLVCELFIGVRDMKTNGEGPEIARSYTSKEWQSDANRG